MRAIQTKYKGYKFRSRLEARWAVYFDSLGLEWEYEKEGFHFEDGTNYLPDFWLPQVNMWAEIKGEEFNKKELKKASLLYEGSGFPVLLLIGLPELKTYNTMEEKEVDIKYVLSCYHNYPRDEGRFFSWPNQEDFEGNVFKDAKKAIIKAKEARFEFEVEK